MLLWKVYNFALRCNHIALSYLVKMGVSVFNNHVFIQSKRLFKKGTKNKYSICSIEWYIMDMHPWSRLLIDNTIEKYLKYYYCYW